MERQKSNLSMYVLSGVMTYNVIRQSDRYQPNMKP